MRKFSGVPRLFVALIFSRFYFLCYFYVTGVLAALKSLLSHRRSFFSLDASWHLPESKVGTNCTDAGERVCRINPDFNLNHKFRLCISRAVPGQVVSKIYWLRAATNVLLIVELTLIVNLFN